MPLQLSFLCVLRKHSKKTSVVAGKAYQRERLTILAVLCSTFIAAKPVKARAPAFPQALYTEGGGYPARAPDLTLTTRGNPFGRTGT